MIDIFNALFALSGKLGYTGVFLLMTLESSFVPFPSEIVIPPAAYLAQQGELRLWAVIAAGVLGSLAGALINYYLALTLGRTVIYNLAARKGARLLLLSQKKIEHAEQYFLEYGKVSTFFGRLVPVIRQLISLPAGFSRMNLRDFLFYTFLGSSLWVVVLAGLGYVFGANQELLHTFYSEAKIILGFVAVLVVLAVILRRRKRKFGRFF
jgi:membrane protein DedA with SNARE-associated domain